MACYSNKFGNAFKLLGGRPTFTHSTAVKTISLVCVTNYIQLNPVIMTSVYMTPRL
jgi:hypothetical protein